MACFLLGLVPVLGVIPGVILYRLAIVAPFRRSIPPGRNFRLRWSIRLVSLVLVAFQWVALLGGPLLPMRALVNYRAYTIAERVLPRRGSNTRWATWMVSSPLVVGWPLHERTDDLRPFQWTASSVIRE